MVRLAKGDRRPTDSLETCLKRLCLGDKPEEMVASKSARDGK